MGHSVCIRLKAKTSNCVVWLKCHINIYAAQAISAVTFSNAGLCNRLSSEHQSKSQSYCTLILSVDHIESFLFN